MQRCKSLRAEHDRIVKLRALIKDPSLAPKCEPTRGESSAWEIKELPTCNTDCSAPLVCFASDMCKCTRDRCGDPRAGGPFPAVAYTDRLSFSATPVEAPAPPSLAERVAAIPWEAIILPGARRAFATPLADLPQAHVISVPDGIDTHLQSPACWNLDKSPLPFVGDHFLIEALRNRTVPIDESDFVVVPYFQVGQLLLLRPSTPTDGFCCLQGCYYNYLQENTFKKLADTISFVETRIAAADDISASKIVVPFTHDYGSCTGWWPRLEDVLGRSPPSPMDQAIAWQVRPSFFVPLL